MDKLKRALTALIFLVFFAVIINDIFNNIFIKKTHEIGVFSPVGVFKIMYGVKS